MQNNNRSTSDEVFYQGVLECTAGGLEAGTVKEDGGAEHVTGLW